MPAPLTHIYIEQYIYGVNIDSLRSRGSVRVKLMQKNGSTRNHVVSVAEHGYEVAVRKARAVRDEWLDEVRREARAEALKNRAPGQHINVALARADVDYVIARFGWKEVDDYFGPLKLMMPVQIL